MNLGSETKREGHRYPNRSSVEPRVASSLEGTLAPLDQYLLRIIDGVTPTLKDYQARVNAINSMKHALRPLGLTVKAYGSLCTGTLTPFSDIDMKMEPTAMLDNSTITSKGKDILYVLSSNLCEYPSSSQKAKISTCIRKVATTLRYCNNVFFNVLPICHAKVPIVKCETDIGSSHIKVDLCFDDSGLETSAFLCKAFSKPGNELARPLTVLVKLLLWNAGLSDPSIGGLGSFPTSVMVLFFFETYVRENVPQECNKSLGVLLTSFLKLYGIDLDYINYGIDQSNKKTFKKPPSNILFITNPLRQGTNCASGATLFEKKIRPLFARLKVIFASLVEAETTEKKVESALNSFFSSSMKFTERRRNLPCDLLENVKNGRTNVWDNSGLYVGALWDSKS